MKQILLLAAIYSLIIHQSHKNAKEKIRTGNKPIINTISSETNSYKKHIVSPSFIYGNASYLSSNRNRNVYAKWENKD